MENGYFEWAAPLTERDSTFCFVISDSTKSLQCHSLVQQIYGCFSVIPKLHKILFLQKDNPKLANVKYK